MRSKQSGKRWVHKGEYVALLKKRIGYCALGFLGILIGILWFLWNSFTTDPEPPHVAQAPFHPGIFGGIMMIIGVILIIIIAAFSEIGQLVRFIYHCFKSATEVESVHLISSRNHHLAPQEECLVRASDLPPTHHQAELLRAATTSKETPPEELLRAGQENRQD